MEVAACISLRRVSALVRGRQLDRELQQEIGAHLEEATEDYLKQGLSPIDARRAALRSFGGAVQTEEAYRERRSFVSIGLASDRRFAVRTWRREPWSATAIALTLALGVGTATATCAIFNQVLFRPVPGVADASRLVMVRLQAADRSRSFFSFSHQDLREMRDADTGLTGLTSAEQGSGWVSPSATAEAVRANLEGVSRDFFRVMGLRMRLGRPFGDDEVETPGHAVVVISEALWAKQFSASPSVIGQTLYLNNEPFTVIGVVERYRGWSLVAKKMICGFPRPSGTPWIDEPAPILSPTGILSSSAGWRRGTRLRASNPS